MTKSAFIPARSRERTFYLQGSGARVRGEASAIARAAVAALFLLLSSGAARAQWAVEVDPATFLLDGYSLHARYSPEALPQWRLGAGIYSLQFPDVVIDLNSDNRDQGWEVDLQQGLGVFVERYFNEENTGWFIGTQVANHDFTLENPALNSGETAEFSNVLVMPYGGYLHRLSPEFYLQGWFGAGYTDKIDGRNAIAGEQYEIAPLFTFAAVHVGYQF